MEAWRDELYHNELFHYGIKNQKWGIRRFQNKDGTYTAEGKIRRKQRSFMKDVDEVEAAYKSIASDKKLSNQFIRLAAEDDVAYKKWYYNTDKSKSNDLKRQYETSSNALNSFLQRYIFDAEDDELMELESMEIYEKLRDHYKNEFREVRDSIDPTDYEAEFFKQK